MTQLSESVICSGCGMVNQISQQYCSGCGSTLTREKSFAAAAPSAKSSKAESSETPQWLKIILGGFILYAVAMFVYEGMNLPSGSVQRGDQQVSQSETDTQTQTPTDPSIVSKISDLEKLIKEHPNDAESILQFANTLHDAKFYPRALEMYKRYLKLNPVNYDARVDLGICYFETGNLDQAVKEIEFVIQKAPKHQMAMFNLGIIQLSSQNLVEAKKWFKKCIEIDPQSTAGLRAQQILEQH